MLTSPPARTTVATNGIRSTRFSERPARRFSPPQPMSGLLLDPSTVQMTSNAFGSGAAALTNGISSQESSPQGHSHHQQSQDFYFADGNVVFLVERTLYRIHRSVLSRNSPFFRNLFSISQPPDAKEVEGTSDDHPLHLPHILVEQFDAFLSSVYPSWRPVSHTTEALINILCLATKWEFSAIRAYSIELLTSRSLSPTLRVELARAYDVPAWLLTSYVEMARMRLPLTEHEGERLGLPTVLRLGRAREAILRQRFRVALEKPKSDFFDIPVHRHTPCWQSMARSLYLVLKNAERSGGTDEDLVDEVLAASRRLQDEEPLCESCSNAHLFRARCSKWLDCDGDAAIVSAIFNIQ